jgi:hypothetical protein
MSRLMHSSAHVLHYCLPLLRLEQIIQDCLRRGFSPSPHNLYSAEPDKYFDNVDQPEDERETSEESAMEDSTASECE